MAYSSSISSRGSACFFVKVLTSWLEQGIDTHEKMERHIARLTQENQQEHLVKSAFGIYDRNLVAKERSYIHKWFDTLQMPLPMIQYAYERTIERIGKLSFAYIDKILTDWHQKQITTVAQAQLESSQTPAVPVTDQLQASFDLSQVEAYLQQQGQNR